MAVCLKAWFLFVLIWHEVYTETSNETGISAVESQTDGRAKHLGVSAALSEREEAQYVFCSSKDLWDWARTQSAWVTGWLSTKPTTKTSICWISFSEEKKKKRVTDVTNTGFTQKNELWLFFHFTLSAFRYFYLTLSFSHIFKMLA